MFATMSVRLASAMHWLAAQPPVEGLLSTLVATAPVRMASMRLLGTEQVEPETLLSVIMGYLLAVFLFLMFFQKGRLYIWGWCYFFISSDKTTKKPDNAPVSTGGTSTKHMKVIFVRHGESEWNAVFNVGSKLLLPIRLAVAVLKELLMFFDQDSLFIDSPLSAVGVQQAWDLMVWLSSEPARAHDKSRASLPVKDLEQADLVAILRGELGNSVMASSNLRRAISTGLISCSPRLLNSPEKKKVHLLTPLQEISRNVDTLALTAEHMMPLIPVGESRVKHLGGILCDFYKNRLDRKRNAGNKTRRTRCKERQEAFVQWMLGQDADCIIVFGHSMWFREFFKRFMKADAKHEAKTCKIQNCGVVAFDFYKDSKNIQRIPTESIKEIYRGFEVKGGKKEKAV